MSKPDKPGSERLQYAILGEDASSTREKLAKYTGDVDWAYLKPHFAAGVLLYVDPALELATVGTAFAEDAAGKVRDWLQAGDLLRPSQPHADHWEASGARFTALVVSPFVLIQPRDS